jgi:hypothetical protein
MNDKTVKQSDDQDAAADRPAPPKQAKKAKRRGLWPGGMRFRASVRQFYGAI